MSARIASSVRDATIGWARPSTYTSVRLPGPRSSSIGIRPTIWSERQNLPKPRNTMRRGWMSMLPPFQPTPLQDIVQHHAIDFAVHAHAHVVVLPVHEIRQRTQERGVRRALRRGEPFLRL